MKKIMLIKLSLVLFLIIFGIIYFIEENYQVKITSISEIDESYFNEYVKVFAKVISISNFEELTFLTLEQNNTFLLAIIFERVDLEKNELYNFEGKIIKYNGELELVVEKIY